MENLKLTIVTVIKLRPYISSMVLFYMIQLKGNAVIWGCNTSPMPEESPC